MAYAIIRITGPLEPGYRHLFAYDTGPRVLHPCSIGVFRVIAAIAQGIHHIRPYKNCTD